MTKRTFAIVFVLSGVSSSTFAARPCPPDINCNGAVNVDDLLAVINNWGPVAPGNPADITNNGFVNVDDLLGVINAWGPCLYSFGPQFPNAEAHQIGLEMLGPGGPLALSQPLYDRIDRDLGLIRAAHGDLASEEHSMAWSPNQLLVSIASPQGADYLCHNTFYLVNDIDPLFGTWYTLTFSGKLNVARLSQIYMSGTGASFAEPNGLIGGQNYWVPTQLAGGVWRWNIDDGWWDCFDGCDCHRYYVVETDLAGNVNAISVTEQGQSWCDFSRR